jgi:hypothetical protein
MGCQNQRGQVLVESVFLVLSIVTLLIIFQMLIDQQRKEINQHRLSKPKKDLIYVQKNENFTAE